MLNFFLILFAALIVPQAAAAAPIGAAIAAVSAFAASSAVAAVIVRVAIYAGLTALSAALTGKPAAARQPGIKTEVTTAGGANPQTFILGRYATAGNRVAPPYSGPNKADTPNEFLSYVVDISDLPITSLSRIAINGDWVTDLRAASGLHQKEGMIINGEGVFDLNAQYPLFTYSFYDGGQTAADAYMMANHASDPDRPWQADMIGAGVAYAVLTFKYNRATFNGLPSFLFEVEGIALYDPRRDTSVGGSGAQRFGSPATWAFTENPAVLIYNILRGIALPDGNIWGGRVSASDLPLANWFAAMNECDVVMARKDGVSVAQYVAGFEVSVDTPPATVIDALKASCAGDVVEVGGVYTMRVGPVSMPVFFFNDDDLSVDDPRTLSPHAGLEGAHNALHVIHPSPAALWGAHDAPPRFDLVAEAEDGRRLPATLDLPAVARDEQVQRLMSLWLKDDRRMRRHDLTLPPEAAALDPLDAVAWTSLRNGYTSKVFEVGEMADDFTTLNQTVSLRERDAQDVVWVPESDEFDVIHPGASVAIMPVRVLQAWQVSPAILADDQGAPRRVGLRFEWDGGRLGDCRGIRVQVRLFGAADVSIVYEIANVDSGFSHLFEGILPGLRYEARAKMVSNRATGWTLWAEATTDDVYYSAKDLAFELLAEIAANGAAAAAAQDDVNALLGSTVIEFDAVRFNAAGIRVDLDGVLYLAGDNEAAITAEAGARATAVDALASTLNAVSVKTDAATADIATEETARASADTAIAGTVTDLSARLNADYMPLATIQQTYLTATQTNNAIASAKTTLKASIGDVAADVSDVAAVSAAMDGKVRAMRGLSATTSAGRVTAIRLTSYENPDGTGGSAIQMDADNVIVDGTLSASKMATKTITAVSGVIGDAAVDTLQIKGKAVTVANFGIRTSQKAVYDSDGWVDICSVNLECEENFNVFCLVTASSAFSYTVDTAKLQYRVTHQGNSFGIFFETGETEFFWGETGPGGSDPDKTRKMASDNCNAFMKTSPGNGVKTFKLQARVSTGERGVDAGLIRVQMVKR